LPVQVACCHEGVAITPADLTPELAVRLAGYSAKWSKVLALHTNGMVAGAIVDSNSDGRWLCMETYWLSDPREGWQPGLSTGAGTFGSGTGLVTYAYGHSNTGVMELIYRGELVRAVAGGEGWWIYVWPDDDWAHAAPPRLVNPARPGATT
jgi:hypothetical protein